jgi:uncharacterized protein (TIRG00374 family)
VPTLKPTLNPPVDPPAAPIPPSTPASSTSAPAATPSKKPSALQFWIRLTLSLGLGGLFLYLSVRNLDVNWSELPALVAEVSPWHLVVFSLGFLVVHLVRMWRWFYLVKPLGVTDKAAVMHASAIGFAAIMILPLRLGELIRPYLLARDCRQVSVTAALGTAVIERVIDGLSITLLLFISLTTQPTRVEASAQVWTAGWISGAIFGATLFVLVLCWWKRTTTIRILRRIGNLVSETITARIIGLLEGFLDGVGTLRAGGDFYRFLLLTAAYWAINGATIAYLAQAFSLDIGLWQSAAVLSILVIGIMIPAAPGHVGTFEHFLTIGLGLFIPLEGIGTRIIAFITTMHILQFIVQIVSGIPSWLARGVSLRRAIDESNAIPQDPQQSTSA